MNLGRAITYAGAMFGAFRRVTNFVMGPLRKLQGMVHAVDRAVLAMGRKAWFYAKLGWAGFTAAAAGAVAMGVKFNAQIESNINAFKQFLGSGKAAQKFMAQLVQLSKYGPFQLTDLTSAGQKFLAFGFSAEKALKTITAIQDAVAATGASAENIDRVVIAMGQIAAKGRVQGDELLQLTEAGIPAYRILKEELGLTSEQVRKIGTAGIDSNKAIAALTRGMNKMFGGASIRQSRTLAGQWSTFKDNVRILTGYMMRPLSQALQQRVLPALNDIATKMQDIFAGPGAMGAKFDRAWNFLTESFNNWWTGGGKEEFSRVVRVMGAGLAQMINGLFGVGRGAGGSSIFWQLGKTAVTSFIGGFMSELKVGGILSSKLGHVLEAALLVRFGPRLAFGIAKRVIQAIIVSKLWSAARGVTGGFSKVGAGVGRAVGALGWTPLTAMWVRIAGWGPNVASKGGMLGRFMGVPGARQVQKAGASSAAAITGKQIAKTMAHELPADLAAIGVGQAAGTVGLRQAGGLGIKRTLGAIFGGGAGAAGGGVGLSLGKAFITGAATLGKGLVLVAPEVGALMGVVAGGIIFNKMAEAGKLGPLGRLFPSKADEAKQARATQARHIARFRRGQPVGEGMGFGYSRIAANVGAASQGFQYGVRSGAYAPTRKGLTGLGKFVLGKTEGPARPYAIDEIVKQIVTMELQGEAERGSAQSLMLSQYGGDPSKVPMWLRRRLRPLNGPLQKTQRQLARKKRQFPGAYQYGVAGVGTALPGPGQALGSMVGPPMGPKSVDKRITAMMNKQGGFKAASRLQKMQQENEKISNVMNAFAVQTKAKFATQGTNDGTAYVNGLKSQVNNAFLAGKQLKESALRGVALQAMLNATNAMAGALNPTVFMGASPTAATNSGITSPVPVAPKHGGGTYRAPNGFEGMALLRDGERVLPTSQSNAMKPAPSISVTFTGAIHVKDRADAAAVGKELASQVMAELQNMSFE
jgi:tape measure domain-containing protein